MKQSRIFENRCQSSKRLTKNNKRYLVEKRRIYLEANFNSNVFVYFSFLCLLFLAMSSFGLFSISILCSLDQVLAQPLFINPARLCRVHFLPLMILFTLPPVSVCCLRCSGSVLGPWRDRPQRERPHAHLRPLSLHLSPTSRR